MPAWGVGSNYAVIADEAVAAQSLAVWQAPLHSGGLADQPAAFAAEDSLFTGVQQECLLQQVAQLCRKTFGAVDLLTSPLMFWYVWGNWEDFSLAFVWSWGLN